MLDRASSASAAQDTAASRGEAREVTRVDGIVKWFNATKGYGFITQGNGGPDVLLHVACLKSAGYEHAYDGSAITCDVACKQDGRLHATKIISMQEAPALAAVMPRPPRGYTDVVPIGDPEQMTCKWFDRVRGFGFFRRGKHKPDVFVHMDTLRRSGIADLAEGQVAMVRFGEGAKGLAATEVRLA